MTTSPGSAAPLDAFFYEAFAEEAERLCHYAGESGLNVGYTPRTIQEAGHPTPPAPVVSFRTQSSIPPDWLSLVRGILTRSTGYDHLSVLRRDRGGDCPPLGYLPLYCARAVAEQAMLLWTALFRRLPRQIEQFNGFQRDHLSGRENAGKLMALFGVGNIGHEIWRMATALDMTVLGVDPVQRHPGVTYVSPEEALTGADLIVCAMNLTDLNRGYFTADRLALARRRPLLVNIARGEFTPAIALETALDNGLISGVALDVYNEEPALAVALRTGDTTGLTPDNHALLRLRGRREVVLTPHNAFNTIEAVERKSEQSIRTLVHLRETGQFLWPLPDE